MCRIKSSVKSLFHAKSSKCLNHINRNFLPTLILGGCWIQKGFSFQARSCSSRLTSTIDDEDLCFLIKVPKIPSSSLFDLVNCDYNTTRKFHCHSTQNHINTCCYQILLTFSLPLSCSGSWTKKLHMAGIFAPESSFSPFFFEFKLLKISFILSITSNICCQCQSKATCHQHLSFSHNS